MALTAPAPRPELAAFAHWLRGQMKTRRLGRNQLAAYLGVSQASISEYARALRRPRLESQRKLAAYFAVPLEEVEALLPQAEAVGSPAPPAAELLGPEQVPAWARPMLDLVDEIRRRGEPRPAPGTPLHVLEDPGGLLDERGVPPHARARAPLVHVPLHGEEPLPRPPPAPVAAFFDQTTPPSPGDVVGVLVGGRVRLRVLQADGRLTTSDADATPLRVEEVDRVLGVARLAQIAL